MSLFDYLEESLPDDLYQQSNSTKVVSSYINKGFSPKKMLNFGCGTGDSFNFFYSALPNTQYTGVDIAFSGVDSHPETSAKIHSYNGATLPFKNNYFDLVYAHLALEQTPDLHKTLLEIARVLTKKGFFIGQTSQFEPYHSLNLRNFTIYGFKKIIENAGMKLIELRPSIDGITLMKRSYTWDFAKYNKYFSVESPLNLEIEQTSQQKQLSNKMINYKKLMFSGQFCFVCALK